MLNLIIDHDHTVADLKKNCCVYANKGKEHCAGVIPYFVLSAAHVISYGFAHGIEPLVRILFRHGRNAAISRQKELGLLDQ
jgi:hypothetical protein